jgi:uncharacterized protein
MGTIVLATSVALALAAGQTQSGITKPPPPEVGAGRVAWFDVSTTGLPKARAFYSSLFGWTFTALQGTDMAVEIVSDGAAIGTLRVAEGPISAFNGVVYVQVADVRAACMKAIELGGTVVPGFPFDLPDRPGAIALVRDPAGHPIGMYSRTPLPPSTTPGR